MKKYIIIIIIILNIFQTGCSGIWPFIAVKPFVAARDTYKSDAVAITDKGSHFEIKLDFTTGKSHKQIGREYALAILKMVPDYEMLVESYLCEMIMNNDHYDSLLARVDDIKLFIQQEYLDEIEGMASVFTGGDLNKRGDGRISRQETYLFNLFPDVLRGTQCSFVSVWGKLSETGKTILGRTLDWYGGGENQLPKIQAVIKLKYPDISVITIGYLGFVGVLTGFNGNGIFASILDSSSGEAYSSQCRRSYSMDLRYALEHGENLAGVSDYLFDAKKYYAFNHDITLSDPERSYILENNFSGMGPDRQRVKKVLRNDKTKLNNNIKWGIADAVECVNSFVAKGNYDNHTPNEYNVKRWENIRKQLISKGNVVTYDELKEVISYDGGSPGTFNDSGDIYNKLTQQVILFQPDKLMLEIFFHPRDERALPDKPLFEKIEIDRLG